MKFFFHAIDLGVFFLDAEYDLLKNVFDQRDKLKNFFLSSRHGEDIFLMPAKKIFLQTCNFVLFYYSEEFFLDSVTW